MDKSQLVTIAVTAAITVVFREIFSWLVSLLKIGVTSTAIRQRVWKTLLKHGRAVIISLDLIGLAWAVWFVFDMIRDQHPVSRLTIALISVSVVNGFYWVTKLFRDIGEFADRWLDAMLEKKKSTNAL